MQSPSSLRLVALAVSASIASLTSTAQLVGTNTAEVHPPLTTQTCTKSGCKDDKTSVVLDSNWRWLHKDGGTTNCYTGNTWDKTLCPDPKTCASSCAMDGADYTGIYGITAEADSLSLKLVTKGPYGTNVGSRVYIMDEDDEHYRMYMLLNQEFTFDVDVSELDCGLNGALYFVEMEADGGMKQFPTNKAGAKYGTGYCDAQCPQDIKFINGEANIIGWDPSKSDKNAGSGKYGACCGEMDIWEANSISNAYTSHPCSITTKTKGAHRCASEKECGVDKNRYSGVCDKDGCDFNPYRMGNKTFFGPGADFTIDTTKKFTVVTRFITDDNTAKGTLTEITRHYVQDGVTHEMPRSTHKAIKDMNSLTDAKCASTKTLFGDKDDHKAKGGLAQMGLSMSRGMVLTISLWADHAAQCLWLDSDYPVTAAKSKPGVSRGTCATTSGVPDEVIAKQAESTVKFTNIRIGDIGTTVKGISIGKSSAVTQDDSEEDTTATKQSDDTPSVDAAAVKGNSEVAGEAGEDAVDGAATKETEEEEVDPAATKGAEEEEVDPAATKETEEEEVDPAATKGAEEEEVDPAATKETEEEEVDPAATKGAEEEEVDPAATKETEEEEVDPAATKETEEEEVDPAATKGAEEEEVDPAATKETEEEEVDPAATKEADSEEEVDAAATKGGDPAATKEAGDASPVVPLEADDSEVDPIVAGVATSVGAEEASPTKPTTACKRRQRRH
uniref:cellulose 1,4-beta-cellobiosidase (non-reducing end) n=1 Tax=Peronospora matthiolae TaxID=2874970 RepID=A0AAV1U1Y5_9STRA